MANRRMFSMKIVDTDAFLDMPLSGQALYFHLAMRADDDGFVANPKKIARMLGNQDDDYKILVAKKFVLPFENGICVIKHWLIHNLIRGDRYTETQWGKQKRLLTVDEETKKYSLNKGEINVIPSGNQSHPQVRLGKDRIGEREEQTPSEYSKDFFGKGNSYKECLESFTQSGNSTELITKEFDKFILYWTEPNGSGTKERWQQQSTFDIKRRLFTWLSRINNFAPPKKESKVAFS